MNDATYSSKSEIESEFLEWYIKEGFMKTSKKDVDIYVLHLLCKNNPGYFQKDLYEISKALKITQSKVKTYLTEVQIRYQHLTVENILEYLIGTILSGAYTMENDNQKICLQVNNPIVLDYLRYKLNNMSIVNDYSFNNSIVVLPFDKFVTLSDAINREIPDKSSLTRKIDELIRGEKNQLLHDAFTSACKADSLVGSMKNLFIFTIENRDQIKKISSSFISKYFF